MNTSKQVIVSGAFDDIRARPLRFLEEASKLGELSVLLWPDEAIQQHTGKPPKFPLPERLYFLNAVRYVSRVFPLTSLPDPHELPATDLARIFHTAGHRVRARGLQDESSGSVGPVPPPGTVSAIPSDCEIWSLAQVWVDNETETHPARGQFCLDHGMDYCVLPASRLAGFPEPPPMPSAPGRRKVVATGCYDWFHSGHVRFTEEASAYGDLYIVVGHDANIRLLKGEGHPLFPQDERRYVVGSVKFVKQALISSGDGWLDADPEIRRLHPDAYIVNEDGDRGGKREYCKQLGIEYIVLKRTPAPGLPRRSSTDLRGF